MYNTQFGKWRIQKRPRRNTSRRIQSQANVQQDFDVGDEGSVYTTGLHSMVEQGAGNAIFPWKNELDSPGCDLVPAVPQIHQNRSKMPSSVISAGAEKCRSSPQKLVSSQTRSSTFTGRTSKNPLCSINNSNRKIAVSSRSSNGTDGDNEGAGPETNRATTLSSSETFSSNPSHDLSELDFDSKHEDAMDSEWVELNGISVSQNGDTQLSMRRLLRLPCSSY